MAPAVRRRAGRAGEQSFFTPVGVRSCPSHARKAQAGRASPGSGHGRWNLLRPHRHQGAASRATRLILPGGMPAMARKAVRIGAAADPRHRDRPGLTSRGDDLAARLKGRRRAAHRRAAIERRYAAYLGEGRTSPRTAHAHREARSRLVPGGSGVRQRHGGSLVGGRAGQRSLSWPQRVPLGRHWPGCAAGREVACAQLAAGIRAGRGWRNGGIERRTRPSTVSG